MWAIRASGGKYFSIRSCSRVTGRTRAMTSGVAQWPASKEDTHVRP